MTLQHAKTIRKKLRELADLAHESELSRALEMLDRPFPEHYEIYLAGRV